MVVLGLTGGICSGKSTCAAALAAIGAAVIDCDKLGHLAYSSNTELLPKIAAEFGEVVIQNGQVHRPTLGRIVFGSAEKLKKLTDLVWPSIQHLAQQKIQEVQANNRNQLIVVEAAVLLEAKWESLVDHICLLTVSNSTEVISRLQTRNPNLTAEEITQRINSQMSIDEGMEILKNLKKPFTVIDGTQSKMEVIEEIVALANKLSSFGNSKQ